ncbi:hypothetical protein B0H13DRAFT_1916735 [Mycena leptocephala]|nr:hypothetical protein B0H13DRAFT_1916735 [Mycena leptocephala]
MVERTEIQQQINRLALLPAHSIFGRFTQEFEDEADPESTVDGAFAAAMHRMGIDDESDEEGEDEFVFARADEDEAWLPYGSRTMFMLDLLDNLPRLRLSDDHLKAIIWVMCECKTPNVPSFSALRKKQESLTRDVGINSQHHTSSLGNHFYMNHPGKLFALVLISFKFSVKPALTNIYQDWANPLVRPFIHVYPEVSELAQQRDGAYVVPLRWITVNNVVHADVQNGICFNINTGRFRRILASSLLLNYLDLCASSNIQFSEYSPNYPMPHPLRETAQGRPMFRLRIMPWSDDVSGNFSKQYNAHTNIIPGVWHEAYDCESEQEILFEIIPHVLPADNPQQSETSSHIGMAGSFGCRRDLRGDTKEYRETDEGYHALYMGGGRLPGGSPPGSPPLKVVVLWGGRLPQGLRVYKVVILRGVVSRSSFGF